MIIFLFLLSQEEVLQNTRHNMLNHSPARNNHLHNHQAYHSPRGAGVINNTGGAAAGHLYSNSSSSSNHQLHNQHHSQVPPPPPPHANHLAQQPVYGNLINNGNNNNISNNKNSLANYNTGQISMGSQNSSTNNIPTANVNEVIDASSSNNYRNPMTMARRESNSSINFSAMSNRLSASV